MQEPTVEQATEKIARKLCKTAMGDDAMWELFLQDAYRKYYSLKKAKLERESKK